MSIANIFNICFATPQPCTEGTTRQVKCPTSDKMVTQKCVNGVWVTIKIDETKCTKDNNVIIVVIGIIIAIIILSFKGK